MCSIVFLPRSDGLRDMVSHLNNGEVLRPHLTFLVRFMEARKEGRHPFHINERRFHSQLGSVEDPYLFFKNKTAACVSLGYQLSRTAIEVATYLDVFSDITTLEKDLALADDPCNMDSDEIVSFVGEQASIAAGRLWNTRFPTVVEMSIFHLERRFPYLNQHAVLIQKTWKRLRHLGASNTIRSIEHYQMSVVKHAGPLCYPLMSPHASDMEHYGADPTRLMRDIEANLEYYYRRRDVHEAYGTLKRIRLCGVPLYTIKFEQREVEDDRDIDVDLIQNLLNAAPTNFEETIITRTPRSSVESLWASDRERRGLVDELQEELNQEEDVMEPSLY